MGIDVVYPLGRGSRWQNNELRFSLRALEKNFLDLGKVYVVGECPEWLDTTQVVHIPAGDLHRRNKDANMIDKVRLACQHPEISEHFVRSSDDELFVAPVTRADLVPYSKPLNLSSTSPKRWQKRLVHTGTWLRTAGYQAHCFEQHIPALMSSRKFLEYTGQAPYSEHPGFCIDTLYFGMDGATPCQLNGERIRYGNNRQTKCHRTILDNLKGAVYLNYTDQALTKPLRYALCVMFPRQSRFELNDHGLKYDPNDWLGAKARGMARRMFSAEEKARARRRRAKQSALLGLTKAQRQTLRRYMARKRFSHV